MGLDGGRSIGIPKSSSERYSKLEFSDSEFVFGGVKFNGGIDIGDGGRERDGDLGGEGDVGGGEGDVGVVEMGIWVLETVMWRVVERGIGGWGCLPILPSKESSGREWRGIGIAGEPGHCGEGDFGGGDVCLFCQARRVLGESGGGIGIAGEPTCCTVSVFFS